MTDHRGLQLLRALHYSTAAIESLLVDRGAKIPHEQRRYLEVRIDANKVLLDGYGYRKQNPPS